MQLPAVHPIRIFLVDDHRTVLWGLERLIESNSPHMSVAGMATNGAEMFEKLFDARPDLILLDLDLDGVCSLSFLQKIMQQTSAQVLILTALTDPAVHQQAIIRGARGVVHKQVSAEILLQAIDRVHHGEIWLDHGEIWLDHATLASVISTISSAHAMDAETHKSVSLTQKEQQIISAFMTEKGARNKLIAERLYMSEHTLRNYLTVIYEKLGVAGRMELYIYAMQNPDLLSGQ